jgi:hypothetical protein
MTRNNFLSEHLARTGTKANEKNQSPRVSIYGTCARITKPHIKIHAQHKSRGPRPTIQPSPAPTIQSETWQS